jgi:hypothetical protein
MVFHEFIRQIIFKTTKSDKAGLLYWFFMTRLYKDHYNR